MAETLTLPNLGEFNVAPAVDDDLGAELVGANALAAKRFHHAYWRKPDGYICVAPDYGDDLRLQLERGMERLSRYGSFQQVSRDWNATTEPFRLLFLKGGAHEFPLAQILEFGWHRKPPYAGVTFPQLDGIDVAAIDRLCPLCQKPFLTDGHLAKHQSIAHKDTSRDQSLGRALAGAMTQAQDQNNTALADALGKIADQFARQNEQMATLMERLAGGKGK